MIHYYAMPGLKRKVKMVRYTKPERVLFVVACHFDLTPEQITGKHTGSMTARSIAMYLLRKWTILTHAQIATMFGCDQHGASIHAFKTICRNTSKDTNFRNIVNEIEEGI